MVRGKKENPEQQELPGVTKKIPAIHEKGLELAGVRSERMELTERESKLAKELLELLKQEKLERYKVEGLLLEVVSLKERIKVRLNEKEEDSEEGGEEDAA